MISGRFNDIFIAGEHYIALASDFSNVDDVVAQFRDVDARRRIVDRAYELVMDGHTYGHRMRQVYDVIWNGAGVP